MRKKCLSHYYVIIQLILFIIALFSRDKSNILEPENEFCYLNQTAICTEAKSSLIGMKEDMNQKQRITIQG